MSASDKFLDVLTNRDSNVWVYRDEAANLLSRLNAAGLWVTDDPVPNRDSDPETDDKHDDYEPDAEAFRAARARLDCLRQAVEFTRTTGIRVLGGTTPEEAQRRRVIEACDWVLNGDDNKSEGQDR